MLTDDGYRQLMKHAKRLAQEGHGELAQHLRDAIDLRAEVEEGDRQSKIMLDSYADENQRISDERDRLRAEVEALRADAERKRGLLLWALYHAQGGSSPVGQPIRRHLGIEQHAHLTSEQISDAARAAQGVKL